MTFTILSSDELKKTLKAVSQFIKTDDELHESKCWFVSGSDYLQVLAYHKASSDISDYFETYIDSESDHEEKMEFCINPEELYQRIRHLPDMKLTFQEERFFGFTVSSGYRLSFSIKASSAKDININQANFPQYKSTIPAEIPVSLIIELCQNQAQFLSGDLHDNMLSYLWILEHTNEIQSVATDGSSLYVLTSIIQPYSITDRFGITKYVAKRIPNMFENEMSSLAQLFNNGKYYTLVIDGIAISCQVPSGKMFNYLGVFDKTVDIPISINKQHLQNMVDRGMDIASSWSHFVFHFQKNSLTLCVIDGRKTEYTERMTIPNDYYNMVIRFDPQRLSAILKEMNEDDIVKMRLGQDNKSPCSLIPNYSQWFLLCPMELKESEIEQCLKNEALFEPAVGNNMSGLMKAEALARMKSIGLYPGIIEAYEEDDEVQVYEPPFGASFLLEDDELEEMRKIEKEKGVLVWGVIRSQMKYEGETVTVDCLLYVSDNEDEWESERYDLQNGVPIVYTTMKEYPVYDHGAIQIYMSEGGTPLRKA